MVDLPGRIGRYELLQRVGRGGMGTLYRARDAVLDREVAIKLMHADFSDDEDAPPRFYREAKAAAKLQHRNIVTIFEFAEEDGVPYIVMEFLRGQSLAARMRRDPQLALEEKLDIVIQLCTGLQYAHEQGVVHRDVKPGNIWLLDDGTVKLLDFGIAKTGSTTLTRAGDVMGSAWYMAPEQVSGQTVDGRADTFSAGVVCYELLANRRPFEAASPTAVMMQIVKEEPPPLRALAPDLPPPLVAAVARALQKDPAARYARAGDFASELQLARLSLQTLPTPLGDTTTTTRLDSLPLTTTTVARDETARPLTEVGAQRASGYRTPVLLTLGAVAAAVVLALSWQAGFLQSKPEQANVVSVPTTPATDSGSAPAQKGVPPPVEPRSWSLKLSSNPAGATVVVDGEKLAELAPLDLKLNEPFPKRLQLSKRGYKPKDAEITAADAKSGALALTLEPEPVAGEVTLKARGSYPFAVTEFGRSIRPEATSHDITLRGMHRVALTAPEYFLQMTVVLDPAKARTVDVSAPELAPLRILPGGSLIECQLKVDGRVVEWPFNRSIAEGRHSIELVGCPDGEKRIQDVLLGAAGNTVRFSK